MNKYPMVKLGDIATFINGYPFKPEDWSNTGLPIIRIQNLTGNTYELNYFNGLIDDKYIINTNDVLISWSASLGIYIWKNQKAVLNQHIFKVVFDKINIDKNYFIYAVKSKINEIILKSHGATMKHITKKDFDNTQIPLPPIEEQRHIAEVLDKVTAQIDNCNKILQNLDLLVKSKFVQMFGDPVSNPMGWEIKKVIDYCDCMVPARDKPKSFTGDIPWITIEDLIINGITYKSKSNLGLTENEINEVKRKAIPKGSVIMSCVGNLGICSIAGTDLVINQQLHSFQCKTINNKFLMYYLSYQKDYMNKNASSTTVLYMNKTICNSIPTINPPIELQNQFAEFVENVEKQKTTTQNTLNQLETLKNALMQKYFS